MAGHRGFRGILHPWGGGTAVFFAYAHASHDLCTGLLVALLPFIKTSLGISYLQSGLLLSAYSVTSGLSQLPGGWLGDRVSRQVVIAMGLGGVGLLALAVGLSSAYYPILVLLVIMGLFSGLYHPSAVSMLSGSFEEERRGRVMALHLVGGSLGFTLGPVLGGLIAEALGWNYAYIILGLIPLIVVPVIFRKFGWQRITYVGDRRRRESVEGGTHIEAKGQRISLGRVLRSVAPITSLVILTQLIAGSAMVFIPLYLVDKHGVAPALAAMLVGAIRGGGIVGSLLGGWLSDKWGRKNAVVLALFATGPLLYLITRLPFNPGLIVLFVFFGIFMYMRQAAIQPLLVDSTPQYLRATIFGIYFGLGMQGRSLIQPVVGHFMDVLGIVDVFNIIALTTVGLSLVALLLSRRL